MQKFIVKMVPKPLHGLMLAGARTCRTSLFGLPDPFLDMERLSKWFSPAAVLDVGAHVGQTAKSLRKSFPSTPLHCFEPTPATVKALTANVAALSNVQVHPFALGDRDGKASFFVNRNSQTNSLLDNDAGNLQFTGGDAEHVGSVEVEVRTLDNWFKSSGLAPDAKLVVKADVQGGEAMLIAGGREAFAKNVAVFYTEVSLANMYREQASLRDLLALLEERGLTLYQLYRTRSDGAGRALWFDAMWINPALVPLPV